MIEYILFGIAGILFFLAEVFVFGPIASVEVPLYEYFEPLSCMFLTISAGFYLTDNKKLAGIISLIGSGLLSKSILIIWLTEFVFPTKFYLYSLIPSLVLFLLYYVSIRTLYSSQNSIFDFPSWQLPQRFKLIFSIAPMGILIGLILVTMTFKHIVLS